MDVDLRKPLFDVTEQTLEPIDFQLRVHSALQENLVAAECNRLFDLPVQFLRRNDVAVPIADLAREAQKRHPLAQMLV